MAMIEYGEMRCGEEQAVCDLVAQVFNELVAPDYEPRGVDEFFRFANAEALAGRVRAGGHVIVARRCAKLVGALEFARPDRIAMLFVTTRGQGIAKRLLAHAIGIARGSNPALPEVTVHASPGAETAYRKMGFRRTGNATIEHGIRYIPMALTLADQPDDR